jgi:ATP-dependent protease ClpP protease subunit
MNSPYQIIAKGATHAEIHILGDIGQSWDDESITAKTFLERLQQVSARTLLVRINSSGGSVPDGLAIFNALRRHPATVSVHIEGVAASIASLIAMAGDTVEMAANALLMIHAPWTATAGNAVALRETADTLDRFARAMATSYARAGSLTQEQALALLTDGQDHWYGADEALSAGMVDRITPDAKVAASVVDRFLPPDYLLARLQHHTPAAAAAPTPKGIPMNQATPTPAAPTTTTAALIEPFSVGPVDAEEIRAEALKQEAIRRQNIAAIAGPWIKGEAARTDIRALVQKAQDDPSKSIETFRGEMLQMLGRTAQALGGGLVMTIEDEGDKFRAAATSGLLIRAGLLANDTTNGYRGYGLVELARNCLNRRGVECGNMSRMEVVGAAFTHGNADFTNLLADVANKAMLKGWDAADETFQLWTSRGTLTDFRAAKRVDLNTFPALAKVEPGAEYKYVTVGDRGETIQLATYGSLFGIHRQAIINDDLDAFTRIPAKMGRAAIRTVGNLVYAILTGNPNMADGVALFHANHANLLSSAALTTASVDLAAAAMAKQTDATGTVLNINMAYLVVPRTLKGLAMTIANSEVEVVAAKTATSPNWMRGAFEVIADARLDASSTSNWFAAANPAINDTIEVAYLDGNDTPTLEQQGGWTVDGVEFKVRIDAGVKALDHRGLTKNPN